MWRICPTRKCLAMRFPMPHGLLLKPCGTGPTLQQKMLFPTTSQSDISVLNHQMELPYTFPLSSVADADILQIPPRKYQVKFLHGLIVWSRLSTYPSPHRSLLFPSSAPSTSSMYASVSTDLSTGPTGTYPTTRPSSHPLIDPVSASFLPLHPSHKTWSPNYGTRGL